MDDLISRQDAIRIASGYCHPANIAKELAKLPSAQPSITRCKDCKYSSPNKVYGCRFEPFDTSENGERMYSDDFCSRAERRTDETD